MDDGRVAMGPSATGTTSQFLDLLTRLFHRPRFPALYDDRWS